MKDYSVEDIEKLLHEVMDKPEHDYSELAKTLHAKLYPTYYPREFWEKVLPGMPVRCSHEQYYLSQLFLICSSNDNKSIKLVDYADSVRDVNLSYVKPNFSVPGVWPHLGSDVCPVTGDALVCVKDIHYGWCEPTLAINIVWSKVTELHILENKS